MKMWILLNHLVALTEPQLAMWIQAGIKTHSLEFAFPSGQFGSAPKHIIQRCFKFEEPSESLFCTSYSVPLRLICLLDLFWDLVSM